MYHECIHSVIIARPVIMAGMEQFRPLNVYSFHNPRDSHTK